MSYELFVQLAAVIGAGAAAYLLWHIEPAFIICLGLALSVFSGSWQYMASFPGPLVPDRTLIGFAGVALLLRSPPARDRPKFTLTYLHLVMAAVALYAIVSMALAGTLSNSAAQFRLIDRLGVVPFLLFAIAPVAFYKDRHRRALLVTLVAVGAYLAFTGLMETLDLRGLVFPKYINNPELGIHADRARGPFLEAEAQGLALIGSMAACIVALRQWSAPRLRAIAAGVLLLCFAGLIFTLARAVWVSALLAFLVSFAVVPRLRRLVLPGLLIGAVGVGLLLAVVPDLRDKVTSRAEASTSVYDRRNQQATAIRMIETRPLLGFGWSSFQTRSEPYLRTSPDFPLTGGQVAGETQVVHNVYLSNAAELGIVGTGLWLVAVLGAIGSALRRRRGELLSPSQVAFLGFAIAWLTIGLFTPPLKLYTTALLFLWAGVLSGRPPIERRA